MCRETTEKDASHCTNCALSDQAETISLQYSREPSWGENTEQRKVGRRGAAERSSNISVLHKRNPQSSSIKPLGAHRLWACIGSFYHVTLHFAHTRPIKRWLIDVNCCKLFNPSPSKDSLNLQHVSFFNCIVFESELIKSTGQDYNISSFYMFERTRRWFQQQLYWVV